MLGLYFNDGTTLIKRIANPITVYDTDLTVPLGPFPVNQYTIGGNLDVSGIEPYLTPYPGFYSSSGYESIVIYADDGNPANNPLVYGNIENNGGVLSWEALITTDAAALPVIIQWRLPVIGSYPYNAYELKKVTLTGNTSGLNFAPTVFTGGESYFIFVPDTSEVFRLNLTSADAFALSFSGITDVSTGWTVYPVYDDGYTAVVSLDAGTPYAVTVQSDPVNTGYTFTANAITWVTSSFDAGNHYREFTYTIPAGDSLIVLIADSDNYASFGKTYTSQDVGYQISWTGGADIRSMGDNNSQPTFTVTNSSGAAQGITVRVEPLGGPGPGTGDFFYV
ncbi:hypothetical protein AGMMS4952_21800 [Spirochaetia bacterium]|nr:hypothetical protein AGMMS4952_21800 [Spirochaetia bacterium]